MRIAYPVLLTAALLAAPAIAKDEKPDDPNRKICHSQTPTGSYFSRRICHTKAEWAAIDNAERRNTDAMRDATMVRSGNTPGI